MDLGVLVVNNARVNPFLTEQVIDKGPVNAHKIVHRSGGTDSPRYIGRE